MLELQHIQKAFSRGFHDKHVLFQDLDLKIENGEFVVIIGSNGSGKSTLLKMISGAETPDFGKVIMGEKNITHLPLYKSANLISRVVQDSHEGTVGEFTLLENLELAYYRGKSAPLFSKPPRDKFEKKLATLPLNLGARLDQRMDSLSGGQRQVLSLLMATLGTPELLLLDEHTSALDPKTAKMLMEFTNTLIEEEAVTTLMITHNLQDAIEYGNRLIMLHHGKIIFDVKGAEKQALTLSRLLNFFHEAEDDDLKGDVNE